MSLFSLRKSVLIGLTSLMISACSSSSHVMIGKEKAPIAPEMVVIYSQAPLSFEKIAMIKASSHNAWRFTAKGKQAAALERLKEEAASLGANGILIQRRGQEKSGYISTGAGNVEADASGADEGLPLNHETIEGVAIWVQK